MAKWRWRTVFAGCIGVLLLSTVAVPAPSAQAQTLRCNGQVVTINMAVTGSGQGTPGDDVILGTGGDDTIDAGAGNDVVCGGAGNDTITGGDGNDKLFGRSGDDEIRGGPGDDVIHGNLDNDELHGDAGNDRIFGYADDDVIFGGEGNDRLHGNFGEDIVDGGPGNDIVIGYGDNDILYGREGDDRMHGNFGDDVMYGGPGADTMFGYGDNDTMFGGAGNDVMRGNLGNDTVDGGDDNDELHGARGNDVLHGGPGADELNGNADDDELFGDDGNDALDGGLGADACAGGAGTDTEKQCESVAVPDASPVASSITIMGGNNQTGNVTDQLPVPLAVQVDDQFGSPLPGAAVTFRATAGGGSVNNASTTTDANGQATADWTLGHEVGNQTVQAEVTGAPGLTTTFTATATIPVACQRPAAGRTFNAELSQQMLTMSAYAYDAADKPNITGCWIERGLIDIASTDTQGFVAENRYTGDVVVGFRGSESITDWQNNLSDDLVSWRFDGASRGRAHEGFSDAYASARSRLDTLLTRWAEPAPGRRVYFTGHSLGGALATIASLDHVDGLVGDGYDRDNVIMLTFGAPRSMDSVLAQIHGSKVPSGRAIANSEDPVPLVPLPSAGYRHIPAMTLLNRNGVWVRPESGNGAAYPPSDCFKTGDVGTHGRDEYKFRLGSGLNGAAPTADLSVIESGPGRTVLNEGRFELEWDGTFGRCARVGIFHQSRSGILPTRNLVPSWEWAVDTNADGHRRQWTGYSNADGFYAGFVNSFGQLTDTSRVFPQTKNPSLDWEARTGQFIEMRWSVHEPGREDFVAMYTSEPTNANDLPALACVRCRERAIDGPSHLTSQNHFGTRTWWIAYVQVNELTGERTILSKISFRT